MFRAYLIASVLVLAAAACSKPVAFQGDTALTITGSPPPPPPTEAPPRVEVRDNKIVINEKVQFAFDKATILPESFSLLDEVASVIQKNPQIKRIRVEGYASSEGNAGHNLTLSQNRAKSVMTYLTKHGIANKMLTSKGFGIENPIADNSTDAGREANRRVEFTILEQDVTKKKVEISASGEEKVLEENTETIKAGDSASASK